MNIRKAGAALALMAVLALAAAVPQEGPLAVVVKVSGDVEWVDAAGGSQTAAVGARLGAGDQLIPGSGAQVVVVHRTGATQVITDAVTLSAPADGSNPGVFSRTVEVLAQAASADTRTELNRQGMIRPIPGEPVLIAPRNGLTIGTTQPALTWHAVDGASGYRVQLRNADGGTPMRFEVESDTMLDLATEGVTLEPGAEYAWTVGPVGSGRATREQRFSVVGTEDMEAVKGELQILSDIGLPPDGDGAFMAAVIYRDMGLFYETLDALMAVESGSDAVAADFYLLKGEVLVQVGREAEAEAAFDTADKMMR
jgi:hypothetical protein